jgi:hypothetical protein
MGHKIENGGININDHYELELEVPRNKNLCSVMEVYAFDHFDRMDHSKKQLFGLATIDLSQFVSFFYLTKQQQIEEIEEQKDDDDVRSGYISSPLLG